VQIDMKVAGLWKGMAVRWATSNRAKLNEEDTLLGISMSANEGTSFVTGCHASITQDNVYKVINTLTMLQM